MRLKSNRVIAGLLRQFCLYKKDISIIEVTLILSHKIMYTAWCPLKIEIFLNLLFFCWTSNINYWYRKVQKVEERNCNYEFHSR